MSSTTFEFIPRSELFVKPRSEVMNLIWKSYEGRDTENMHEPDERITRVLGLRHAAGALAAAAVLEKSRIMIIAITPDPIGIGRLSLGGELLKAVHDDGVAAWVSIGDKYPKAHDLVETAGMQRVNDAEVITALFDDLERPKDYGIEVGVDGSLVAINGPASSRPGHRQQIWAWDDRVTTLQ